METMGPLGKLRATMWGAAALYLFPSLYGTVLLLIGFNVDACSKTGSLFVTCCIVLGISCCITTIIGLYGVWGLNEPAIRATLVVVVLENILAFLLAIILAVHLVRGPTAPPPSALADHKGPLRREVPDHGRHHEGLPDLVSLLHHPQWHEAAAIAVCAVVIFCTSITSCCIGILSEFQATLDAELLLEECRNLREAGHSISGYRLPPPADSRRGSSGSSTEGPVAVPFVSSNGEGFFPLRSSEGPQH